MQEKAYTLNLVTVDVRDSFEKKYIL